LSVVSFDDTPEALHHGLTSYNFDVPAVVRAMLSHLHEPRASRLAARQHAPVVIEGFVTERGTSGPA
jgi:hypothetical protein